MARFQSGDKVRRTQGRWGIWVDFAEDAAAVARALDKLLTQANSSGFVNNTSDLVWSFEGAFVASVNGAPSGLRVVWESEIEAACVEVGRDFC